MDIHLVRQDSIQANQTFDGVALIMDSLGWNEFDVIAILARRLLINIGIPIDFYKLNNLLMGILIIIIINRFCMGTKWFSRINWNININVRTKNWFFPSFKNRSMFWYILQWIEFYSQYKLEMFQVHITASRNLYGIKK